MKKPPVWRCPCGSGGWIFTGRRARDGKLQLWCTNCNRKFWSDDPAVMAKFGEEKRGFEKAFARLRRSLRTARS